MKRKTYVTWEGYESVKAKTEEYESKKKKEKYVKDCGGIQPLPLHPPILDDGKKGEK